MTLFKTLASLIKPLIVSKINCHILLNTILIEFLITIAMGILLKLHF